MSVIAALSGIAGATVVLGPYSLTAGMMQFSITLQGCITTGMAITADYSGDGGMTWQRLGGATSDTMSALLGETEVTFTVGLGSLGPAGSSAQVRFSLTGALAFSSTGGTLVLV